MMPLLTYCHEGLLMRFAPAILLLLCIVGNSHVAYAQSIQPELLEWWKANAPTCSAPDGFLFVAKNSGAGCGDEDDRKSTLYAGLLCAAGEPIGCETVKRAQDPLSGRWFRSPRRAQSNNLGQQDSFGPDMAIGNQLYLATQSQAASMKLWLSWLDAHRTCWIGSGDNCVRSLLIRFCTDDTQNRCTAMALDLGILASTSNKLGQSSPSEDVNHLLNQAKLNMLDLIWSDSQFKNDGVSQHLVGAEILLLRRLGITDQRLVGAAHALAGKQPNNPFFLYLSEGPTQKVVNLTLSFCPTPATGMPHQRNQWAWEGDVSQGPSSNSMLWDCVFMARLIASGK